MSDEETTVPRAKKVGALAKYFGKKDGQNLQELMQETKALSDEDVDQLHQGIDDGTYNY